jgi:hypothetical protein
LPPAAVEVISNLATIVTLVSVETGNASENPLVSVTRATKEEDKVLCY